MKIGITFLLMAILIFLIQQELKNSEAQEVDYQKKSKTTQISETDHLRRPLRAATMRQELDISQRSPDLIKMVPDANEIYLTDEELRHRVEIGLANQKLGMPFPTEKIPTSMQEAYDSLKGLIPKEIFPQWGYETADYYVFSGRRSIHYSEAFMDAYLISKKTGDDTFYTVYHKLDN